MHDECGGNLCTVCRPQESCGMTLSRHIYILSIDCGNSYRSSSICSAKSQEMQHISTYVHVCTKERTNSCEEEERILYYII